jgi:hypothetical protein
MNARNPVQVRTALMMAALGIAAGALIALWSGKQRWAPTSRQVHAVPSAAPTVAASGDNSIPRLTRGPRRELAVETYADAPGYKPADFVGVTPLSRIFRLEPRMEAWARPMEAYLSEKIRGELNAIQPGLELKGVECRTACCRVDFESLEPSSTLRVQQTLVVLYSSAAVANAGSGDFILAYRGRTSWLEDVPDGDSTALVRAIEERRRRQLTAIKSGHRDGKPSPFKHLDPDTLPDL